jgi:hypothetical protein
MWARGTSGAERGSGGGEAWGGEAGGGTTGEAAGVGDHLGTLREEGW